MSDQTDNVQVKTNNGISLKKKALTLICVTLGKVLPRRTKRLILISTIIGGIKNIDNPSKTLLRKINELLEVSVIDEAIALPMVFGKKMWRDKLPEDFFFYYIKKPPLDFEELDKRELKPAEVRIAANTIIKSSPGWLKYDSNRVMRSDVVNVLSSLPRILETA
jgi:hypothetical protein